MSEIGDNLRYFRQSHRLETMGLIQTILGDTDDIVYWTSGF